MTVLRTRLSSMYRLGFTLIEVSLVLIIIGLLSAAALLGRELIRASDLRKSYRQFEEFSAASRTFRVKYNCLAGDCPTATMFFGKHPGCPDLATSTPATPGQFISGDPGKPTCDGDGDGGLDISRTIYEMLAFWQHLANAGLIGGSYTGGESRNPADHFFLAGRNVPFGFSEANGWIVFESNGSQFSALIGQKSTLVPGEFGKVFELLGRFGGSVFSPLEAQAYDAKYDDGLPTAGRIMVPLGLNGCTSAPAGEGTQDAGNLAAHYLANDEVMRDNVTCNLLFQAGL